MQQGGLESPAQAASLAHLGMATAEMQSSYYDDGGLQEMQTRMDAMEEEIEEIEVRLETEMDDYRYLVHRRRSLSSGIEDRHPAFKFGLGIENSRLRPKKKSPIKFLFF